MRSAKDLALFVAMAVIVMLGVIVYRSMYFVQSETKIPGAQNETQKSFVIK